MPPWRLRAVLVVAAASALLPVAPALASTSLVAVEPGNGSTVGEPPATAVLTFSRALDADRSSATVTVPGGGEQRAASRVEGDRLVVTVPDGGPGGYLVGYAVAAADAGAAVAGEVGFTVGRVDVGTGPGGTAPWAVASGVVVLGLLAALLLTYRRWRDGQ